MRMPLLGQPPWSAAKYLSFILPTPKPNSFADSSLTLPVDVCHSLSKQQYTARHSIIIIIDTKQSNCTFRTIAHAQCFDASDNVHLGNIAILLFDARQTTKNSYSARKREKKTTTKSVPIGKREEKCCDCTKRRTGKTKKTISQTFFFLHFCVVRSFR